jgi:hypothetical protein
MKQIDWSRYVGWQVQWCRHSQINPHKIAVISEIGINEAEAIVLYFVPSTRFEKSGKGWRHAWYNNDLTLKLPTNLARYLFCDNAKAWINQDGLRRAVPPGHERYVEPR